MITAQIFRTDVNEAEVPATPEGMAAQYEIVPQEEWENIWSKWLPTLRIFSAKNRCRLYSLEMLLERYNAPADVVAEFELCKAQKIFDWYELRTPEHSTDPLLTGVVKNGKATTRSKIAIWGESIRSIEEIFDLVSQSDTLKNPVQKLLNKVFAVTSSVVTIFSIVFPLMNNGDPDMYVSTFLVSSVLALSVVPTTFGILYGHPTDIQQNFLDKYRA